MEKDIDLYVPGRPRDEKDHQSIYFTDPDGHKFEFHTGTMKDRIDYDKQEKSYMEIFGSMIKKQKFHLHESSVSLLNRQCRFTHHHHETCRKMFHVKHLSFIPFYQPAKAFG